jgi:hypothetical protein
MSEEVRGYIYRGLTVVFFALVAFGVITAEEAENYMTTVLELAGLLGFALASRNTSGVLAKKGK